MTVYCERDTQKQDNHCVKCGGTWVAGTPLPACSEANGFIPATDNIFRGGQITAVNIMSPIEGRDFLSHLLGIESGEPFFILRASDPLAGYLVETWAHNAETQGIDPRRVQGARIKAQEFRAWRQKKT